MTEILFETDGLTALTSETRALLAGGTSSASGPHSSVRVLYDPTNTLPLPLQVLRAFVGEGILVTVETATGYVYQGTLLGITELYDVTLTDVTVTRRRLPHVDFANDSVTASRGTHVDFKPSVLIRGRHVVLLELPSTLKSFYQRFARSVKQAVKAKRKQLAAATTSGKLESEAGASGGPSTRARAGSARGSHPVFGRVGTKLAAKKGRAPVPRNKMMKGRDRRPTK